MTLNETLPFSQIGVWKLIRKLGQGAVGDVFLVQRNDGVHSEFAALKLVTVEHSIEQQNFSRERALQAKLSHPNIARLIDGGQVTDDQLFMVTEWLEGNTLLSYAQSKNLSQFQRLDLFKQLCEAVKYLHRFGFIHGDIKPDNILIDAQGQLKLIDFGITQLMGTAPLHMQGSPAFCAPEVWQRALPEWSQDIYSLGMTLYSLLSDHDPSQSRSNMGLLTQHLFQRSLLEQNKLVLISKPLRAIVLHATQVKPTQRYADVAALQYDIEQCQLQQAPKVYQPLHYRFKCFLRGNPILSASVLGLVFFIGVGLYQGQIARFERDQLMDRENRLFTINNYLAQIFQHRLEQGKERTATEALDATIESVKLNYNNFPQRSALVLLEMAKLHLDMHQPAKAMSIIEFIYAQPQTLEDETLAWLNYYRAYGAKGMRDFEQAKQLLDEALAFFAVKQSRHQLAYFRARALWISLHLVREKKWSEALVEYQALYEQALQKYPNEAWFLGEINNSLASVYFDLRDLDMSLSYAQQSLTYFESEGLGKSSLALNVKNVIAGVYYHQQDLVRSAEIIKQTIQDRMALYGPSEYTATLLNNYAITLHTMGEDQEALTQLNLVSKMIKDSTGTLEHSVAYQARSLYCLIAATSADNLEQGEVCFDALDRDALNTRDEKHPYYIDARLSRAELYISFRRFDQAEQIFQTVEANLEGQKDRANDDFLLDLKKLLAEEKAKSG